MIGKTHLATALGYAACQHGYSVLFANAIDAINTLNAAQTQGALKTQLKRKFLAATNSQFRQDAEKQPGDHKRRES